MPSLMPKEITDLADTWFSARMVQACAKQACGIVRGCRKKHEKRLFVLDKLNKEGQYKKARKLFAIIKNNPISKPEIEKMEAELDSRFVNLQFHKNTSFDGWLTLSSIGGKKKIVIPVQSHKHAEQLRQAGKLMPGIRLGINSISLSFKFDFKPKKEGRTVGIDIGMNRTFSCSDGSDPGEICNGHTMKSVCEKIARKKRGSDGFRKSCQHRRNLIGYFKNRLDWSSIKKIRVENIKHLRTRRKRSRYLDSFVYREIFGSLRNTAEKQGVLVEKVDPAYTSQRCSCCGWTRKRNRKGRKFDCSACNFTADADFNASTNISLDLRPIGAEERRRRPNLSGFYWKEVLPDRSL